MSDEISARLKRARRHAGLTQNEVAKALGITLGAVSQWETGNTLPRGRNLVALSKLYKVSPAWLSHGEGSPEPANESSELYWISSFDTCKASLRRANVDPAAAACAFVSGDSMEPLLPDGACVGIDTSSKPVKDGDMYAIDNGGLLRIKMLYRLPGGGLRVHSVNPAYPDEFVTPEQMQEGFRVIGRVFWYSVMV